MGARVIAIDIDDRKRNIALECGAQRFLNSQQCDVAAELVLLNDGRGPEVVIEAVGNQQTIEQATGWWRLAVVWFMSVTPNSQ